VIGDGEVVVADGAGEVGVDVPDEVHDGADAELRQPGELLFAGEAVELAALVQEPGDDLVDFQSVTGRSTGWARSSRDAR
jgi:hypothetical protein